MILRYYISPAEAWKGRQGQRLAARGLQRQGSYPERAGAAEGLAAPKRQRNLRRRHAGVTGSCATAAAVPFLLRTALHHRRIFANR